MGKPLTPQERTLDDWFSKYIRARDTKPGYCYCCTCGKYLTFETAECGHFITRDKHAVRWDERNAHAQCTACNNHRKGEQAKHMVFVDRKHGKGTADLLMAKGSAPCKWTKEEILEMTKMYREKFKALRAVNRMGAQ